MQTNDPTKNRLTPIPPLRILRHDPRPDLDLLPDLQHARQDRPARYAAFELVYFGAGLVYVEGADDD